MTHNNPPGRNKGGRPLKNNQDKKTRIITLKCTAYDKQVIRAKAGDLGISVSDFLVKAALNRQFDSGKHYALPIPKAILLELKGHLGPIGNNLNQLVKSWHNRTRIFTAEDQAGIVNTCHLLKDILTQIENFLK